MKTVAIIVAGGKGKRMGGPKQFLEINGKPMLSWTISVFQKTGIIDGIILVVAREQMKQARKLKFAKIFSIVAGGEERQDSVKNGLRALPPSVEMVAIHDGARPLITEEIIVRAVKAAQKEGAVVVGVPVKDTLKKVKYQKSCLPAGTANIKNKVEIIETIDRAELWQAQTPQVFRKDLLLKAYRSPHARFEATDDACLVEKLGYSVTMVMGSAQNLKVTTREDLTMAAALLKERKLR
jgi:2-C-methyl-D-erythritol 4-phosphate cytidylyltransferase